ncbi:hypothetical protein Clacol_004633 [Clathrus columnatus]|uniref:Uncharacterized protein n=1 Tax=Clathrus columnatus TaxID=1419009 RepID=A0AAV5AA05_9AGAM|nr:hypothetical protein Clacol_004633 [Clathrus columnatus]
MTPRKANTSERITATFSTRTKVNKNRLGTTEKPTVVSRKRVLFQLHNVIKIFHHGINYNSIQTIDIQD